MPAGSRRRGLALLGAAPSASRRHAGLQLGQFGAQPFDVAQQRIEAVVARHAVGIECGAAVARQLAVDRAGRDADHGGVGRHGVDHHGVGADAGIVADGDRPQHLGAGADDHVVAHRRVALAAHGARDPQRDLMIEVAIVADLGGLADHHAHAMIDDKPPADLRGRMDLDPGQPAGDMGGKSAQQVPIMPPQPVGQAVPHHCMQPGIAKQHLQRRTRGGIAFPIACGSSPAKT